MDEATRSYREDFRQAMIPPWYSGMAHLAFILLFSIGGSVWAVSQLSELRPLEWLTLPLTFHMDPVNAVTLLIGEYVGGISGGLITAILLRMPSLRFSSPPAGSGSATAPGLLNLFLLARL